MTEIQETQLPGVGVRHDFLTRRGTRIGVIAHRSGHRELLVYDQHDPDACRHVVRLEEDDARALTELLGGSHVTEALAALQAVDGLAIDWLPVEPGAAATDHPLDHDDLRARTGVAIVAVVRRGETIPSPASGFRLEAGDTAVAIGTSEGIRAAFALLRGT